MYAKHGNLLDAGASAEKPAQITFRGYSRSRILASPKSRRWTA